MCAKYSVAYNTVSVSSGAFVREMNILRSLPVATGDIDYEVLCAPATRERVGELGANVSFHEVTSITNSMRHPAGTTRRLLWDNIALPRQVRRLDTDLLYFPLQITNLLDVAPKVVAVRNAAPFYRAAQPDRPLSESVRLSVLRRATRRSIRQAERVIFFTQTTLDRVAEEVPLAREKGVVVPHGIPEGFGPVDPDPAVLTEYDLPDEFLLSVSNIARYKKQVELVEGYSRAASETELPPLVLAGKTVDGEYASELSARIETLGLDEAVHRLGFVDHDHLPELHAASMGFLFSSACENAPMTLIEALACGTPIACSNATSMPEICGDAALYFDPENPEDIATAIGRLASEPELRAELRAAALKRAERYSWERAGKKTHEIFKNVLTTAQQDRHSTVSRERVRKDDQ